jgi:hypothetical protein
MEGGRRERKSVGARSEESSKRGREVCLPAQGRRHRPSALDEAWRPALPVACGTSVRCCISATTAPPLLRSSTPRIHHRRHHEAFRQLRRLVSAVRSFRIVQSGPRLHLRPHRRRRLASASHFSEPQDHETDTRTTPRTLAIPFNQARHRRGHTAAQCVRRTTAEALWGRGPGAYESACAGVARRRRGCHR